jgi:hypothetical protein
LGFVGKTASKIDYGHEWVVIRNPDGSSFTSGMGGAGWGAGYYSGGGCPCGSSAGWFGNTAFCNQSTNPQTTCMYLGNSDDYDISKLENSLAYGTPTGLFDPPFNDCNSAAWGRCSNANKHQRPITAGHSMCFAAGTLVCTEHGQTAIENLHAGEWVRSGDTESDKIINVRITKIVRARRADLIELRIGSQAISMSSNHGLYTADHHIVLARELCERKRDLLIIGASGRLSVLRAAQYQATIFNQATPVDVYNLRLEDGYSYFVGRENLLVESSD